jgi:hypothetical protein
MLGHYESLSSDAGAPDSSMIISHPDRTEIKTTLEQMPKKMKNPYIEVRRWLKWEILDMQALLEAVDLKTQVDRRRVAMMKKVESLNQEIKDLQQGKQNIKHLKHLFYTSDEKVKRITGLRKQIDQSIEDADVTTRIYKLIVYYQFNCLLPFFKDTRIKMYTRMLSQYTDF